MPPNIIDTREPVEIYEPLLRLGWQRQGLPVGDYQFYDAIEQVVLVERKTISQFITDMQSGQLQRQAILLTEAADFPWLYLEGEIYCDLDTDILVGFPHITGKQIRNQLRTLQDLGCRYERTNNISDTIKHLLEAQDYYGKDFHKSVARHPAGDARISVLYQIPGIGAKKAKAILGSLPTLKQVANAGIDELEQVEGIGRKLAIRINKFWEASSGD